MQETIGTLSLKIARLQQQLKLLEQRQILSSPYPHHQATLNFASTQIYHQLCQLMQIREEMKSHVVGYSTPAIFTGDQYGQKPFFSAH